MKLKDKSINPASMSVQMLLALTVVDKIYARHGYDLVITSLNDGKHMMKSLHYSGNAADLRTRYFNENLIKQVAEEIKGALPTDDYDLVIESDHFHLEYQPKRR